MSGSLTQVGHGPEIAYGTAVAPTKWFEILSEGVNGNYPRIQAEALSAALVDRSDRIVAMNKGASGPIVLEPLSKGFGNLLRPMFGTVVTTGPLETNAYTHTATLGTLTGISHTVHIGRATEAGVVKPWVYEGGKCTGWSLSNQADQTLRASLDWDFELESQADTPAGVYILAANVPVVGAEVLTAVGGLVTVAGVTIPVTDVTISVDSSLKVDRPVIQRGVTKREPVQDGKRKISWSFKTSYIDNSLWKKVSAAQSSGSFAIITATWQGLTLLGTTIYPSLAISIPVAQFDDGGPNVDGPSLLEPTYSGKGLYDGAQSAITAVYTSGDVTVI